MRPSAYISDPNAKANWRIVLGLFPYLFEYKWRVLLAVALLIGAKLANVALPYILKLIVDDLDQQGDLTVVVPAALLILYGAIRFGTVFLGEMRDAVFARVTERTMRRVGLKVFTHLHALDLEFHLSRKTGGLSRDIERGVSGISFLMRFLLFNIVPTLFEIALVALILYAQFTIHYLLAIILSVFAYIAFSVVVTEWRTKFVREANEKDSLSNTRAVDSLLNYETVKYFNNEDHEKNAYDENLADWEKSRLKNRLSLAFLNSGQAFVIATSVTVLLFMAANGVASGSMTLGDFVMVNAYLLQLFIPLNFLGFVYREIRQALINVERMFGLLDETPKVKDPQNPVALDGVTRNDIAIEFNNVSFAYHADRPILKNISFRINPGEKCAIVGESGSGKSTIAKLLFRFYDVDEGSIEVAGHDVRDVSQQGLRALMGVVPQDTVLFNDTIAYNIAYGQPGASQSSLEQVAAKAHLDSFIQALPNGWQTKVGERGLKVSGGEKQRISIARVLLKNPPILIFDEATSALDTQSEQKITRELDTVASKHTSLIIAHRLSTVANADKIIVLDKGRIVEIGNHNSLLAKGQHYAELWRSQEKNSLK